MSYGNAHTEPLPTVEVTAGPEYATLVNAVLTELRTTVNAKVTPAGIDISTDLSMRSGATNYGLTEAHRVSLYQQPTNLVAATYPAALYASSAGDLYFNDASGNQIALTSAGAIAASAGSITGAGYGTPVELQWNNGETNYHFFKAASTYADIKIGQLLLSDASSNFLIQTVTGMGSNYTVTWPAAVPASSSSVIQVSTTGVMTYASSPSLLGLTVTGTGTLGSLVGTVSITAGAQAVTATDMFIIMGAAGTVTLEASPTTGRLLFFRNTTGSGIQIGRNGRNIDGAAANLTLPAGEGVVLAYAGNASGWWSFATKP